MLLNLVSILLIMDPIRASLKGKSKPVSPVVRTIQPVVVPQPTEGMSLSDKFLMK